MPPYPDSLTTEALGNIAATTASYRGAAIRGGRGQTVLLRASIQPTLPEMWRRRAVEWGAPAASFLFYFAFLAAFSLVAHPLQIQWFVNDPARHLIHFSAIPAALWMLAVVWWRDPDLHGRLTGTRGAILIICFMFVMPYLFVSNLNHRLQDRIWAPYEVGDTDARVELLKLHDALAQAREHDVPGPLVDRAEAYRTSQGIILKAATQVNIMSDGNSAAWTGVCLSTVGAIVFGVAVVFALTCTFSREPIRLQSVRTLCIVELLLCLWLPCRMISVSYAGFGNTDAADDLYWIGASAATVILVLTLYPLYRPGSNHDLNTPQNWFFPAFSTILPLGPGLILSDVSMPVERYIRLHDSMKIVLHALVLLVVAVAIRFVAEDASRWPTERDGDR